MSLDPPKALRYGCAFVGVLLLLAIIFRLGHAPDTSDNPAYDALVKAHTRRMAADSVALDSAKQALATSHTQVTRAVTRYQTLRDTFNIHDTLQVIVFRERADSVKRSCTALDNSCDRFRVRADSSLASLTTDRDFWRDRFEHAKPSKWAPVREWGIRIAIGYGAFKLGQAAR